MVFSEKHQSENFELRAMDKLCNLFGAEFCDMKSKLLLGGVVERGVLLIKKNLFLQQGLLRFKFFFSNFLA